MSIIAYGHPVCPRKIDISPFLGQGFMYHVILIRQHISVLTVYSFTYSTLSCSYPVFLLNYIQWCHDIIQFKMHRW